jgi:hypothetical protein
MQRLVSKFTKVKWSKCPFFSLSSAPNVIRIDKNKQESTRIDKKQQELLKIYENSKN